MKVDKKTFADWACSLSGCDGGDPTATIWLCGIEWGFSKRDGKPEDYYKKILPQEISNGKYTPPSKYDWQGSIEFPYGKSVAKLYAAIKEQPVEHYRNVVSEYSGTEIFKLNLYPIAFNSTDDEFWKTQGLDELTGFSEKHLFKTWCFLNRFPWVRELVAQKKPKLVIGTGIGYLTDFFACFAGHDPEIDIHSDQIAQDGLMRNYYWARTQLGTTLVVIPFLSGRYGLNSNKLIQEMGNKIRWLIA